MSITMRKWTALQPQAGFKPQSDSCLIWKHVAGSELVQRGWECGPGVPHLRGGLSQAATGEMSRPRQEGAGLWVHCWGACESPCDEAAGRGRGRRSVHWDWLSTPSLSCNDSMSLREGSSLLWEAWGRGWRRVGGRER